MSASSTKDLPIDAWPSLPLDGWRETYQALHSRAQLVGKTRLALAPMENHWWQVVLYVTPRGLSTSTMHQGHRALEIELDFLDHQLVIRTSDGDERRVPLRAEPVAAFFEAYLAALRDLGIQARIWPVPVEMAETVPFPEQREAAPYDADAAQRCWRVLSQAARVLKRFRGQFLGKCSPVHFWWGGFDLSCTRFSGEPAPPHPGGIPHIADWVTREAYSHACISAGWWPGTPGFFEEPAFYAYAYPEPAGCPEAIVRPQAARYDLGLREWILPYEAVRTAEDPDGAVMEFLESTYAAAATLGGWNRAALERR
ncbi:MAG TPA: DUF5996 family protein [Thermoanaerobaculia bacterium]|jgi:hypothetical protein|nr:DUF5996 family protein [Thermoanaerobaculia bacterium]